MNNRVCKEDLIQRQETSLQLEQNVSLPVMCPSPSIAAELLLGNVTLRLFNGADEQLIQNTLRCIGGINHAW